MMQRSIQRIAIKSISIAPEIECAGPCAEYYMAYLSTLPEGKVLLRLHIQPKASKNRIVGFHDGCLKIAVAAPPVEGKANKALVGFLADIFGIPARDVVITSGAQSRKKQVVVIGQDASVIRTAVEKIVHRL